MAEYTTIRGWVKHVNKGWNTIWISGQERCFYRKSGVMPEKGDYVTFMGTATRSAFDVRRITPAEIVARVDEDAARIERPPTRPSWQTAVKHTAETRH